MDDNTQYPQSMGAPVQYTSSTPQQNPNSMAQPYPMQYQPIYAQQPQAVGPQYSAGAPQQQYAAPYTFSRSKNTYAIVGLILSFIIPIAGFVLSIVGLTKSSRLWGEGRGLSIAGIIISVVVFILELPLLIYLAIFIFVAIIFLFATVGGDTLGTIMVLGTCCV